MKIIISKSHAAESVKGLIELEIDISNLSYHPMVNLKITLKASESNILLLFHV